MEQRPYGAYAVYETLRWWPLFALPLIRLVMPNRDTTVRAMVQDVLFCAVFVGYAVVKWRVCRYRVGCSPNELFYSIGVRQGLLMRRALYVDAGAAASVEIECTPLLGILGGRRVRVNTAGLRRRADVVLYLSVNNVRALFATEGTGQRFRARIWHIVVAALSASNVAVGLLTVVPALRQIGAVLGEQVIPDAVGALQTVLTVEIPVALRTTANLLVLSWSVAALNTFLRFARFSATVRGEELQVVSGLFTRRDVRLDRRKITGVELRQTLLMRVFSLHSVFVTAAGYGRDIGARPVLIPAADRRALQEGLQLLLPAFPFRETQCRPLRRARMRYVLPPLVLLFPSVFLWAAGAFWQAFGVVLSLLGIWWLTVRMMGFRSAGLGVDVAGVTVRYPRGLALYSVHLPREVVDYITVTQSFWQRRSGTCTVVVRCFGEKKRRHRVWGLSYEKCKNAFSV